MHFGRSLTTGDVDGDAIHDLIIGAQTTDPATARTQGEHGYTSGKIRVLGAMKPKQKSYRMAQYWGQKPFSALDDRYVSRTRPATA